LDHREGRDFEVIVFESPKHSSLVVDLNEAEGPCADGCKVERVFVQVFGTDAFEDVLGDDADGCEREERREGLRKTAGDGEVVGGVAGYLPPEWALIWIALEGGIGEEAEGEEHVGGGEGDAGVPGDSFAQVEADGVVVDVPGLGQVGEYFTVLTEAGEAGED
jgi:hypothetical protein